MNSKIIYSFQTSKKILCDEINNILDNNIVDNKEELFRKIGGYIKLDLCLFRKSKN